MYLCMGMILGSWRESVLEACMGMICTQLMITH